MISILSLVYNHEKYLDSFFTGILSQKVNEGYELIIGIDKSDDTSLEICIAYQKKFPDKIKLVHHTERVGMFQNFLSVYNLCKNEYIAFCEGDDYWIDEFKLQKQLDQLRAHPAAVISYTDIKIFDEEDRSFTKNWATITKTEISIEDLLVANVISTCSVLMRLSNVTIPLKNFEGLPMLDWPLYVHALLSGIAVYLPDQTAVYRQSFGGTYSKNSTLERLKKVNKVYCYFLQEDSLKKYRRIIKIQYFKNLYAVAIRLNKKDPNRSQFLRTVVKKSIISGDSITTAKAFIRLIV